MASETRKQLVYGKERECGACGKAVEMIDKSMRGRMRGRREWKRCAKGVAATWTEVEIVGSVKSGTTDKWWQRTVPCAWKLPVKLWTKKKESRNKSQRKRHPNLFGHFLAATVNPFFDFPVRTLLCPLLYVTRCQNFCTLYCNLQPHTRILAKVAPVWNAGCHHHQTLLFCHPSPGPTVELILFHFALSKSEILIHKTTLTTPPKL